MYEKFRFSSGDFTKNRFFRQIYEKFRFFQEMSKQKSIFPKKSEKFRFFGQFYWLFTAISGQYSISLQKSPLSNTLPIHDKI